MLPPVSLYRGHQNLRVHCNQEAQVRPPSSESLTWLENSLLPSPDCLFYYESRSVLFYTRNTNGSYFTMANCSHATIGKSSGTLPALLQEREVEVLWECDLIALLWGQDQIKDHKKLALLWKRNLLQRCESWLVLLRGWIDLSLFQGLLDVDLLQEW